jgi:hypothetical protein
MLDGWHSSCSNCCLEADEVHGSLAAADISNRCAGVSCTEELLDDGSAAAPCRLCSRLRGAELPLLRLPMLLLSSGAADPALLWLLVALSGAPALTLLLLPVPRLLTLPSPLPVLDLA